MIKVKQGCPSFVGMDFSNVDHLLEVLPWLDLSDDHHFRLRRFFANTYGEPILRKRNRVIYSDSSELCKQIGSRLKAMDGAGGDGMMRVGRHVKRGAEEFWVMRSVFRDAMMHLTWVPSAADVGNDFARMVDEAQALSPEERFAHLSDYPAIPKWTSVTTRRAIRNPYVVAETLARAKGVCEMCLHPAPFIATSTGQPYLEVHHVSLLAEGGTDTIDNTLAVCPNCHRKRHFGK